MTKASINKVTPMKWSKKGKRRKGNNCGTWETRKDAKPRTFPQVPRAASFLGGREPGKCTQKKYVMSPSELV